MTFTEMVRAQLRTTRISHELRRLGAHKSADPALLALAVAKRVMR